MRYNNQMNTCEPATSAAGQSRRICRQARPLLPPEAAASQRLCGFGLEVVVSRNNFTWALPLRGLWGRR